MNIDINRLTYRKSTAAVIVDKKNNILLVQKVGYKENEWEFPGGGVEDGEAEEEAIIRELNEELGTDKFILVKRSVSDYQYDWPEEVIERKLKEKGRTWRGQIRAQFLVKFLGELGDIKFQKEEIRKTVWVSPGEIEKYLVFPNQLETSKKLLEEFRSNLVNG
jgi:mutator protein MutT